MLHHMLGAFILLLAAATTQLSASEECSDADSAGTSHCFLTAGGDLKTWRNASGYCSGMPGYSFPILDSEDVQRAMEKYMYRHELFPESVWIAGKIIVDQYWSWTDGTIFTNDDLPLHADQLDAATMKINSGVPTFANNSVIVQEKLICRLTGDECKEFSNRSEFLWNGADHSWCYVVLPLFKYVKSTQKWYTARNMCLQLNGDLADANVTEAAKLSPDVLSRSSRGYYVGLRQHRVVWVYSNGTEVDVKMTYFEGNAPSYRPNETCLAVRYSGKWVWQTKDCAEAVQVVCHKVMITSISNTTSMRPTTDHTERVVPTVTYGGMIGIAVGASVFFVLVIIAVVLLTFCITRWRYARDETSDRTAAAANPEPMYDDNKYAAESPQGSPRASPPNRYGSPRTHSDDAEDYEQPDEEVDYENVKDYGDMHNVNIRN